MINLKNKFWIFLGIIVFIILCGVIFFFLKNKNTTSESNYESSRTSTNQDNSIDQSNENNNISNNLNETNTLQITENATGNQQKSEEEISSFSTKIYNNDSARQNNISITCNTLNDTIIANGSSFSFCNTVGQSTSNKGYQEADIFDKNGNKKKGLGGGNCQVSTTLYNAVLKIPSLVVTERHRHSNKVPYIQNGKDAAVAYGSYDLKFTNNTGYDVKIKAQNTSTNITISLYKLI